MSSFNWFLPSLFAIQNRYLTSSSSSTSDSSSSQSAAIPRNLHLDDLKFPNQLHTGPISQSFGLVRSFDLVFTTIRFNPG
ncbi:hypothetical protein QVD17_18792 [Tagetes erecta]|uniref:Uncharacterized protein n=1 Tax=Tagetes erecta TaxID=13708 RepID=A0AAD8KIR9_TARER|nr:hypothetical protein QVD17_18792 [Tagetes erecta]